MGDPKCAFIYIETVLNQMGQCRGMWTCSLLKGAEEETVEGGIDPPVNASDDEC